MEGMDVMYLNLNDNISKAVYLGCNVW